MRALVLNGPGDYEVRADWPIPDIPEGWVLVKVRYAGVCGSDLPRFAATGSYHHPMIIGHEFCGTIADPGNTALEAGTRVAVLPIIPCGACENCRALRGPFHCLQYQFIGSRNDGGFAQYCAVPAGNLFALPGGLDIRAGAFIEPISVALHAVRRSGFQKGQTAAVFGAGAIGILIAQWLKALGAAEVRIGDVRDENLALARAAGLKDTYNPIRELPARADVVFEAAGSGSALLNAIEVCRDKGAILALGRDTKDTVLPLKQFERLMRKELSLIGCWGYDNEGEEQHIRDAMAQGSLSVLPLITQTIRLEDAPETIRKMVSRQMHYCKVLINMENEVE